MWRGHNAGGMRPTGSISTRHILDRPQPRVKYVTINRRSYYYPPKSSQKEAGSAFHQAVSQVWPPENLHRPSNEVHSAKTAGDNTVWKYFGSSFLPRSSGGHWGTMLPTPRRHFSGLTEANELAAVGVQSTSNRIRSSTFLSFPSQPAPHTPSINRTFDTSVIKSNPGRGGGTPSITDSKGSRSSLHGREEIQRVASDGARIFSTTPHEQEPAAAQRNTGLSSSLRRSQPLHQKDPTKEVQYPPLNAPLYQTDVAQHAAQTHSLPKDTLATAISSIAQTPTQLSSYPASGIALESFAPRDHADAQYGNDPSSEKPVVQGPLNEATEGFRGFENPTGSKFKEPAPLLSREGSGFQPYRFDRGNVYRLKFSNSYPLSPVYSFGLRGTTTAKLTMMPIHSSLSPSPGVSDITQTTTVLSENNTHPDVDQTHRQLGVSKTINGLKGLGSRPLEGAEASVREPDESDAFQQDFEGFELRSSQIWQPRSSRINSWYDPTSKTEQGTGRISTQSQTKPRCEDLKPAPKAAGSVDSVKPRGFSPDKYKKNHKAYVFLGFQPVQRRNGNVNGERQQNRTNAEPRPTTLPSTHKASSAGGVAAGVGSRPVARLSSGSTSSRVRGRRVKGERRRKPSDPKSPTRIAGRSGAAAASVTYADILGSASFSGAKARARAADRDPKEGARGGGGDTSAGPEANAEDDEEDFSSVEGKKRSVGGEEGDAVLETSGAPSRDELFNHVASESQALSEDFSELDYLQKSTGNISFKSLTRSHSDKW